jgi:hypothetical protein
MEHPQVKEEELEGSQPKPLGEEQNITSIPLSHHLTPTSCRNEGERRIS